MASPRPSFAVAVFVGLLGCGGSHRVDASIADAGPDDARAPGVDGGSRCDALSVVDSIDVSELGLAMAPAGSSPLRIGLFFSVPEGHVAGWSPADLADAARRVITNIDGIFLVCGIHVVPEVVQVVALPERLMTLDGNMRGSLGGHPPSGDPCPRQTTYDEGARLTAEARELFTHGKCFTSDNAIAMFTVGEIVYYIGDVREGAAGLSFPPNALHDPDDYPLRNSVLLVGRTAPSALPLIDGAIVPAHELGHMLLSTGLHEPTPNLMSGLGTELRPDQCDTMLANLVRLFGAGAVPDPGRPVCE